MKIAGAVFVGAWIFQFIGHGKVRTLVVGCFSAEGSRANAVLTYSSKDVPQHCSILFSSRLSSPCVPSPAPSLPRLDPANLS